MKKEFEQLRKTRMGLLYQVQDLDIAQLNKIPEGFNNNIIWNIGHIFTGQQRICYLRSGLKPVLEIPVLSDYTPQSKPFSMIEEKEIINLKKLFVPMVDRLEEDYEKQLFVNYETFSTPYGFDIASIDDAIRFMIFHEGLHAGYIQAMKRMIDKK